jgi:hypothetical protein
MIKFPQMKNVAILSALLLIAVLSCKKEDEQAPVSGTITINNNLKGDQYTGYYAYGFNFTLGSWIQHLIIPILISPLKTVPLTTS